jgi:hypothetical protein
MAGAIGDGALRFRIDGHGKSLAGTIRRRRAGGRPRLRPAALRAF